jgi:hypothetical protein
MSEIENITEEMLADWINYLPSLRKPGDTAPEGFRNFYYIAGEKPEKLWFLGDKIIVKGNKVIVYQAETKEDISDGHGVIKIKMSDGVGSFHSIANELSKQEVLDMVEQIKRDNPGKVETIRATWYNKDERKIEVLIEEPEDSMCEESIDDIVDDISNMLEDDIIEIDEGIPDCDSDDLPF